MNKSFSFSKTALVIFFLTLCSSFAFIYYFQDGRHLPYADSMARLNIARKVVDNMTPGIAQLGSVWLPLPQILMLPFIWNKYLWQSGIAGSIMSMTAYILGGMYIYKLSRWITKSFFGAVATLLLYALNINVLYLQTTALSESLFMCLLSMTMYYLFLWIRTQHWRFLIISGAAVSGLTLTRYEGLPVLFASIAVVFFYSLLKKRSLRRMEGSVILFATVACLGFGLWTLYLTAIFGDPLFWMGYYAAPQIETTKAGDAHQVYTQSKPFLAAAWQYLTSVTWMSGVIPVVYAGIGLLILAYRTLKKHSWDFLAVLLPASIFVFMALTLQRNTPIVQPDLTIANILSPSTSTMTGFNIRYGLMVFPWIVVLAGYLFSIGNTFVRAVFLLLFAVQLVSYVSPRYTAIYQIPQTVYGKPYSDIVTYMQQHYTDGPIFISASGFEDQMFQMGFDYKTYIHEGAGKYWKEALDHPARYAAWVIVDFNHPVDWLGRELKHKQYWSWFYDIVYDSPKAKIYRVKTKPDLTIPGATVYTPPSGAMPVAKKTPLEVFRQQHQKMMVGVNIYDLAYLPKSQVDQTVRLANQNGITAVRLWGFGEGMPEGFQPEAGKYNEKRLDALAYALSVLQKHDMKAIITLGNYWGDYGGVPKYLQMDGFPSENDTQKDVFFSHQFPKNRYRSYMEHILNYESKYSGQKLKDDPALLAWELLNEPRSSTMANGSIVIDWLKEMSARMKQIDGTHLVLPGTDGFSDNFNAGNNGPKAADVAAIETLDAVTGHYYDEWNTKGASLSAILSDWASLSHAAGKPFILEEIGFDKTKERTGEENRATSLQELLQYGQQTQIEGVFLWNWSLKKDDTYGISPLDPKDKPLIDVLRKSQ